MDEEQERRACINGSSTPNYLSMTGESSNRTITVSDLPSTVNLTMAESASAPNQNAIIVQEDSREQSMAEMNLVIEDAGKPQAM